MIGVYAACLIFGGTILAVTLLTGIGGDVGLDTDFDAGDIGIGGGSPGGLFQYLSLRSVLFFVAFFGLAGTALTVVGSSAPVALVGALAVGAASGAGMHALFDYLRATDTPPPDPDELVGARGQVLVPCARGARGKVRIDLSDRSLQVLAEIAPEAAVDRLGAGEAVVLLRFAGGVAMVAEDSFGS